MNRFFSSYMRGLFIGIMAVALLGCKKEENLYLELDRLSLYVDNYDTTVEVGYTAHGEEYVAVSSIPDGWRVEVDAARSVLQITSPAADAEEMELSGTLYVTAYDEESHTAVETLYVSMVSPIDLSEQRSNCYVVTQSDQLYTIPVNRKGESEEVINPSSVDVVWMSPSSLISHLEYWEGELMFRVVGESGETVPGNALVAAYDSAGEILWSWHIWVTPTEPQAVGRYMDRNLGAGCADPESDEEKILHTYGTYYQWGRMTPFVGPATWNCAASEDAALYNESGRLLYITYADADAERGNLDYALKHPLTFLLGNEESQYDWNRAHDSSLWSVEGAKSLYDPCPKGWRVADNFDELTLMDDLQAPMDQLEAQFGWHMQLGDGSESFFLGAGRRSWLEGLITNVNTLETPKPWIGYYWTAQSASEGEAQAMYFSLDTEEADRSEFDRAISSPRANGMQVRCVREE